MTTFIYALRCPKEQVVRYVGMSRHPTKRYRAHLGCKDSNLRKVRWIKKLMSENLLPILEILEEVPYHRRREKEQYYIDLFKSDRLTNIALGGEGGDTYTNNPNLEAIKRKLSAKASGAGNSMFGKSARSRKILVVDPDGNQHTFDEIKDFNLARLGRSQIFAVLKGKKEHHRGYRFSYVS